MSIELLLLSSILKLAVDFCLLILDVIFVGTYAAAGFYMQMHS